MSHAEGFTKHPTRINGATTDKSTLQLYHQKWEHLDKAHVKKILEENLSIKVKLEREICKLRIVVNRAF